MKRRLFTFAIAALTIGLLGSCSKINERIDGLDKRVYDLENNKIASVEQQITAINTSINELKTADVTINGKIADLTQYKDGNRIDLTLIDVSNIANQADFISTRKVLINKDNFKELRDITYSEEFLSSFII